ncbi:hypothetical protein HHI36_022427 [Cryptolaemus montrouzieri]|uniref:Alpha-1,3/1,6-mannosyltransferase ALG2 n=1 Tax=Cryptolaemus montrouzieri TaxID=559131 RepID=A0ABD2N0J4_9CUCU
MSGNMCIYQNDLFGFSAFIFIQKDSHIDLYVVDLIPIAIPFLKRFSSEPVIYYCHHPDLLATSRENTLKKLYRKPLDWIECKATKTSNITLVNSKYTASVFQDTFPEITTQVEILYPTISSSVVELLSSENDIKINSLIETIPNGSVVFLSINRFHPAKNLEVAILAMNHLKFIMEEQRWNSTYFILAGGYDPQSHINEINFTQLSEITKKFDLEKKIIFMKSPSDNTKVQLLKACSCLVYTPLKEHFGIVPLEAMMAKKPVIAFNSGGPRETVEHGENGYLCESNFESLAHFMNKMINDGNFNEMGEKGYQRLQNMFSNELFSDKLRNIVQNALED